MAEEKIKASTSVVPGIGAKLGNESMRLKRTKKEIEDLVITFRNYIEDNPRAQWRLEQLFVNEDERHGFLGAIARDIPSNDSPIEERRRCCNWEGFLTTKGKYAVGQVRLPETNDPWVTFANRLVVFAFAKFRKWEDLALVRESPFYMKCRNPRCVRLNHILYKRDEVAKFIEEEMQNNPNDEQKKGSEFSYSQGSSQLLSSSKASDESSDPSDFSSMESTSSEDSSSEEDSSDDSSDEDSDSD